MVLHATYPQTHFPTADMQPTCSSAECPFLRVHLQTLLKQYLFTDSATLPFHCHFTWELSVTEYQCQSVCLKFYFIWLFSSYKQLIVCRYIYIYILTHIYIIISHSGTGPFLTPLPPSPSKLPLLWLQHRTRRLLKRHAVSFRVARIQRGDLFRALMERRPARLLEREVAFVQLGCTF